jgi:hypothetical protein
MAKIPKSDQSQIQVGNTNQRNKWANTIYRRWDQVPRRSKHPLFIDHTGREPSSMIMNEYILKYPPKRESSLKVTPSFPLYIINSTANMTSHISSYVCIRIYLNPFVFKKKKWIKNSFTQVTDDTHFVVGWVHRHQTWWIDIYKYAPPLPCLCVCHFFLNSPECVNSLTIYSLFQFM